MKIAICGAGVAGVSSAIALTQAGFDVSIYERHAFPANIGAGIVVWPNAAYVLDRLGVLSELQTISGNPTCMHRLSSRNLDLGAMDIKLINHYMGYPSLSVFRSEFQNVLIAKLAKLGVKIQYSHPVSNIDTTHSGQAQIHFHNGKKVSADVIIGADGRMASLTRRYVHGDNAPVYQGFINWIGVCDARAVSLEGSVIADYWGVGKRFGIVPVTRNKAYWAGGIASDRIGDRNPLKYKAELYSNFSQWPQVIQNMIKHTPAQRINKLYVHDHDPIQTWHKDNLVVIGDAAHAPLPTSGQGACQALEDAWHLTQCLKEHPGNVEHAFIKFNQKRLDKTTNIIFAGRKFAASLFDRDKASCKARDERSKNTDFIKMAADIAKSWAQDLPLELSAPPTPTV